MRPFPLLLWKKLLSFPGLCSVADRFLMLALVWILAGSCPIFASSATTVTMTVTSGGNVVTSVSQGAAVTLTATVLAGSTPVTTGQVNFCDAMSSYCMDIHLLATAQLTSAGMATFKFLPGPGSHSYKAVFVGTSTNAGSSSIASALSVIAPVKIPTTTSIAQSGVNGIYTLTAMVGSNGTTAPTGTVSFIDTSNANAVLTTATLGAGTGFGFLNTANPTPGEPIAVGDFNGDGIPDVVIADQTSGTGETVTVQLGNGDGTFTAAPSLALSAYTGCAVTGDFNGDGILDLAMSTENAAGSSATVTVLLGEGDGTFTPVATNSAAGLHPEPIVAGDFNGDGIQDLAVEVVSTSGGSAAITVLLGKGDGTFTPATGSPQTGAFGNIAVGDFNGDGIPDLAVINADSSEGSDNNTITILLCNGDGSFTSNTLTLPVGNYELNSLAVGDFNGDGFLDLAATNDFGDGSVTLLTGDGHGNFSGISGSGSPATGLMPGAIAVGDFNGDGIADLAVGNSQTLVGDTVTATVLLGGGNGGGFGAIASNPAMDTSQTILAADFNGDGLSDLAGEGNEPYTTGGNSSVWLAADQVATATATGVIVGSGPHLVKASYPGDTTYGPSLSAGTDLTSQTVATTLTLSVSPSSPVLSGTLVTLTATLSPAASGGFSTDGETVTFYNGSSILGIGTLAGGVALLDVNPESSYNVSAKYAGDNYFFGSVSNTNSVQVSPPLATTLTLSVIPNPITYGGSVTMTATLSPYTDQGVTANGQVTFSYSTSIGNPAAVQANLSNGVATTTGGVCCMPAGIYQVQATYPGNSIFVAPSPATVTLTVNKAVPTITLTSSANPAPVGTLVTFTAAVPVAATPSEEPYEIVAFYDGTTQLGMSPLGLGGGGAIFSTSTLVAGSHTITAQYLGDSNYASVTSAPLTEVIGSSALATPTIALTSSANPASVSNPVIFTVSLTSSAAVPTGTVGFYDGTTQIGSGMLSMGATSYTTSSLATGTHAITAEYSGDANNSPITSSVLTETIESFMLSAPGGGSVPAQTASLGGQANYALAIGPPTGATFPATVTFSVTGLPTGATATFSPATLPANMGATNVTMTVTLPSQSATTRPLSQPFVGGWTPMALGLILLPFAGRLRKGARRWKGVVCLIVLIVAGAALTASMTACGSGGSNGGGSNPASQTYTLTITATSGSLSQSTTTSLTVQ